MLDSNIPNARTPIVRPLHCLRALRLICSRFIEDSCVTPMEMRQLHGRLQVPANVAWPANLFPCPLYEMAECPPGVVSTRCNPTQLEKFRSVFAWLNFQPERVRAYGLPEQIIAC